MPWLVDLIYLLIALLTAPVWLIRMIKTGKIRTDWPGRLGRVADATAPKLHKRILLHAVSVGEINAIRLLVDELAASPGRASPEIVIATTTDTGFARAMALWRSRHHVVRYPLDFSFAVNSFLKRIDPDVVVLVELEVWPNFTAACARRHIPVCVVNGRLTERSFRGYRRIRALIRPSFRRLAFAAVQTHEYADRFRALGTPAGAVHVTGTMKWDTAMIADHVDGADELARSMGIRRDLPLIVAGSTEPSEHALLDRATPQGVQLLCAPRRPEWFDQAAADLPGCVRRSHMIAGIQNPEVASGRFLLDSIGELRQAYALADVVVVGRSFGQLHGSDMIEPIALGKATVVGPEVSDFQESMKALLAGDGVVQTTAERLPTLLGELLADPIRRAQLATNGRAVIKANQGATKRNAELILSLLARSSDE